MTLKETIQTDFVIAMKSKDVNAKSALSGLKAKITEAEKTKGNVELNDSEVIKVITAAIKQRKQSFEEFNKGGREDLATKEYDEMLVLEKYMPNQMSSAEILTEIFNIMSVFDVATTPKQRLIGQTIGTFNKKFPGRADAALLKEMVEHYANEKL